MPPNHKLEAAVNDIYHEYCKSMQEYGNFLSLHDGYGILLEEKDELWDEIKRKPKDLSLLDVYKEAKHVAAMALKMMLFVKLLQEQDNDK